MPAASQIAAIAGLQWAEQSISEPPGGIGIHQADQTVPSQITESANTASTCCGQFARSAHNGAHPPERV
mgnify:CR=1 FL=1